MASALVLLLLCTENSYLEREMLPVLFTDISSLTIDEKKLLLQSVAKDGSSHSGACNVVCFLHNVLLCSGLRIFGLQIHEHKILF